MVCHRPELGAGHSLQYPTKKGLSASRPPQSVPCEQSGITLSLAIGIGVACGLGLDKGKVDVNALKS